MASRSDELEFVDAVAQRVVELLREEGMAHVDGPRLLTVADVAAEYGVSTDWLYSNARQLGAIRLGSGPRARLRFERATIGERIATMGAPARRRPRARRDPRRRGTGDLLPIRDTGA